ncbi:hypothetical protein ACFVY4_19485 [Streptomyces sp. NPDC058299]|uniref:hypothetical protein n=1 Tax=Streptomyces sp. NPDC058299 TaxID=3346435 RepID=UPI0036E4BE85
MLAQAAGGTVTAVGSGAGQMVTDLVRERLARSDTGRSAIRSVEAQPADPQAAAGLRAVLQAEVDADPDFARQIAAALAAVPPQPVSGSITIDGSTVRGRNTISLGPVTINNTRNARYSLLTAALVFVALVALGVYGGARLIAGDDPGQGKSVTPLTDAAAYQVLPDLAGLPPGWTQPKAPDIGGAQMPESAGLTYMASVDFLMGAPDADLHIRVAAFTSAEKAHNLYLRGEESDRDIKKTGRSSVSMPRFGDESHVISYPAANGEESGSALSWRVGTVWMLVSGEDLEGQPFNGTWLKALGKMMSERAQQAQNGQEPTATVRNG